MRPFPGLRRAAVATLVPFAASCMEWKAQDPGRLEAGGGRIAAARVVLGSGEEVLVRDLAVRGDSLVGADAATGGRVAVARDRVVRLERRGLSDEGVAALVVASLAAAGYVALLVVLHAGDAGGRS